MAKPIKTIVKDSVGEVMKSTEHVTSSDVLTAIHHALALTVKYRKQFSKGVGLRRPIKKIERLLNKAADRLVE